MPVSVIKKSDRSQYLLNEMLHRQLTEDEFYELESAFSIAESFMIMDECSEDDD